MHAEIVDRSASWVLGIEARINPAKADYRDLWGNRFMPRHEEIRRLALDGDYYGVYYGTGKEGEVDFVAGMRTGEVSDVPDRLVLRSIPAGLYARIQCTMSTIVQTWGEIYREWLPSSRYLDDPTRPGFEQFPSDMSGAPDAPLTVFVGIKPRL